LFTAALVLTGIGARELAHAAAELQEIAGPFANPIHPKMSGVS